jgi:hypothetical protein
MKVQIIVKAKGQMYQYYDSANRANPDIVTVFQELASTHLHLDILQHVNNNIACFK